MNLRNASALATMLAGMVAPAAHALDFGPGLSLTGEVELEYISTDSSKSTVALTDLMLSWRSQSGGGVGYGFDLGGESFNDLEDSTNLSILWGGLVVTTGFGEFTFGNPRPLLDTLSDRPAIAGVDAYEYELSILLKSTVAYALLATPALEAYGLSFKGESGALSYGFSAHRLEFGSESTDVLSAAAAYATGQARFYAGIEDADEEGSTFRKLVLGGEYTTETFRLGAHFSDIKFGSSATRAFELFGDYKVTDNFTIGAQVLDIESSNLTLYGITGTYGFGSGGFGELGYGHNSGGSDVLSASIGYRF